MLGLRTQLHVISHQLVSNTRCHTFMVSLFSKLFCLFKPGLVLSYRHAKFFFLLKMDSLMLDILLAFTPWSQEPTLQRTEQLSHIWLRISRKFLTKDKHKLKTKVIILQFVPNITILLKDGD